MLHFLRLLGCIKVAWSYFYDGVSEKVRFSKMQFLKDGAQTEGYHFIKESLNVEFRELCFALMLNAPQKAMAMLGHRLLLI